MLHTRFIGLAAMVACASAGFLPAQSGQTDEDTAADVRILQSANLPVEGPGLLQFFRERTLSKEQIDSLPNQVRLLDSEVYSERVKASAALVKAGPLAKKLLLDVIKDPASDLESVRRAEGILRKIVEGKEAPLAVASAHLIARQQVPDAGQTLLGYVPFAPDSRVLEEVQYALNAVAVRDGKLDPVFLTALADKQSRKRAAAAESIIRAGGAAYKKSVAPLLADADPLVRMSIIVALVEARDRDAVSPLIDLLSAVSLEHVDRVEELLERLAGKSAPNAWIGGKLSPKDVQAAWHEWWRTHGDKVDLATLDDWPGDHSFLLVQAQSKAGGKGAGLGGQIGPGFGGGPGEAKGGGKAVGGTIMQLRLNKRTAWRFDLPRYPADVQELSKERVLLAEYFDGRITERDHKGAVVWEKSIDLPVACRRLPNGQTVVANNRRLLVLNREGEPISTYLCKKGVICAAGRARDGHSVLTTTQGQCIWLDADNKEVKTFSVGKVFSMSGTIDVLPGHRILLPHVNENRVVEYNAEGERVWQATVTAPLAVRRLHNGNTLVATGRRAVELNRDGQEVWAYEFEGRVLRLGHR